jgi:hypothetical protein
MNTSDLAVIYIQAADGPVELYVCEKCEEILEKLHEFKQSVMKKKGLDDE